MRHRLLSVVAVLFVTGLAHAQRLGPVDWIFVVDTSKSMRGIGGTKDIFNDVKGSLETFVREANNGDSVAILTFDRDVRLHSATTVDAAARDDLSSIIRSLKAEGDRTHLGAAIAKGLERAQSLRARSSPDRARAVVLFTDGKEDVRGIDSPVRIDSSIEQAGEAFIYLVSMGEHEPQLDAFAEATPQTTVMKIPTREAIRSVAGDIRKALPDPKPTVQPAPPPPPPPIETPVEPPSPWMRALKVLIALAIVAIAAFLAIRQQRKKNSLEGELEILRPPATADTAFVGLPQLQATEVALSSILPADALGGSDARLFVKRKEGKKKVWIAAQAGSLRINDVETPLGELYDADTIEIGDAKLRFNRVGDDRPLAMDYANQEGVL